jgi:hypothetical protein
VEDEKLGKKRREQEQKRLAKRERKLAAIAIADGEVGVKPKLKRTKKERKEAHRAVVKEKKLRAAVELSMAAGRQVKTDV